MAPYQNPEQLARDSIDELLKTPLFECITAKKLEAATKAKTAKAAKKKAKKGIFNDR